MARQLRKKSGTGIYHIMLMARDSPFMPRKEIKTYMW